MNTTIMNGQMNGAPAPAAAPSTVAYNAFAQYATNDDGPYTAAATANVQPYRAAFAPVANTSATLQLFDETALSWMNRDSTHQQVPNAVRQMHASIPLWEIMPCYDPTSNHSTGFGVISIEQRLRYGNTRLNAGDVIELYGRGGVGKTELMYASVAHAILPKTFTASELGGSIALGGLDGGSVFIDFDYRFSLPRLEQIIRARITAAATETMMKTQFAEFVASHPDLDEQTRESEFIQQCESKCDIFFASSAYATFRRHFLGNIFCVHAQTPRQALVALNEVESLLQDYGNKFQKFTWSQKEAKANTSQQESKEEMEPDGDVRMENAELYDPSPSSTRKKVTGPPPRMVLLLIDNIAVFHWQTYHQPIGYAGIANGLYTKERAAVGAGVMLDSQAATNAAQMSSKGTKSWFYELFSHRLRSLIHSYHLIGIVSKPPVGLNQLKAINDNFSHDEYLGLTWNSIVTYRLVMREVQENQINLSATRRYVPGSNEEAMQRAQAAQRAQNGVLRAAAFKTTKPPTGTIPGTIPDRTPLTFEFRIRADGVTPGR